MELRTSRMGPARLGAVRQRLERNDRRDRDCRGSLGRSEMNTPILRPLGSSAMIASRNADFERPGMVANPSALSRLMKPSLASRSFSASTTNSRQVCVKSDFDEQTLLFRFTLIDLHEIGGGHRRTRCLFRPNRPAGPPLCWLRIRISSRRRTAASFLP